MAKKASYKASCRKLEAALGSPTLEDVMAAVNGGVYERFFLKRPRKYRDGSRECLTAKGAKVYGRLVSVLYACSMLTESSVEDIVEELDMIANEC